jgi:mannose-1-phosphate guanylyltransferase
MKLILLSGGSGKRLWPLSNDSRSKQFLKVLPSPNGELESMVQRIWRQLSAEGLDREAHLSTGRSQVDAIQSQLGHGVPIIVEPDRRDTFPAIALAATYLYSVEDAGLNEIVAVLPVDSYVEDRFFSTVKSLERMLAESGANIALIGVKPTHPSEKYGYIVPAANDVSADATYVKVSHFVEKPRQELAQQLIEQQALWNCGVFAFRLNYIINLLITSGYPIQYDEMLKQYHRLPKISFDYQVLEKEADVIVVPYDGAWKDLGTWNTLTEEMGSRQIGKGIIAGKSDNSHLVNELDIPIALVGVRDVVVAASPDGILVTSKEASPGIKDVVSGLEQRPMYEERRWGWYKVIDYGLTKEGKQVLTKRLCIYAGHHLSYQKHDKRSEVWTIVSGHGEFVLNERLMRVSAGDVLHIPAQARHSIRADSHLEIIEVQTGSLLIEEDIVRLAMSWEEILSLCAARKEAL